MKCQWKLQFIRGSWVKYGVVMAGQLLPPSAICHNKQQWHGDQIVVSMTNHASAVMSSTLFGVVPPADLIWMNTFYTGCQLRNFCIWQCLQ